MPHCVWLKHCKGYLLLATNEFLVPQKHICKEVPSIKFGAVDSKSSFHMTKYMLEVYIAQMKAIITRDILSTHVPW